MAILHSDLVSAAGTPLFHAKYRLYTGIFITPSITGLVTAIFSLPDSFLSASPGDDGGVAVNASPVFQASCSSNNNADGMPLTVTAFGYAADGAPFGTTGPILWMRFDYPLYAGSMMTILLPLMAFRTTK